MYFIANLAFVNYFDKTIEALGIPVPRNWTTEEQVLPISVEAFEINASLLNAPKTLKDFVHQYKNKNEITDLQAKTHEKGTEHSSKFGSFLNSFLADILLFSAALVTMIITLVVIYTVCGQSKYLALQHAKGIEAADTKYQEIYCACEIQ